MLAPEIKRLLQEFKEHKKLVILVAISGIVNASMVAFLTSQMKSIFDGVQAGDTHIVKEHVIAILLVAAVQGISRYVHLFNMNYLSELVCQGLRQKLQKKFMSLNLTFHNSYQAGSGGLISRILSDIVVIFHGLRLFADFFRAPLQGILALGMLLYYNTKLTLIIIVVLPLVVAFLRVVAKFIRRYSTKGQEDLERITGTIKETLDGVRIIQSFNLESEMETRFKDQSVEYLHSRRRTHSLMEFTGPVTEFIMTVVVLFIIGEFAVQIAEKTATLGDFLAYVTAIMMVADPIKKLQEAYVRFQETSAAAKRAFTMIDEDSEVPQDKALKDFPENWRTITYKNVSFRYGENWILKNVNLVIQRGQMVAFVGASGSGKSTLVNLLARFFDPTEGQILIDEVPVNEIRLHDLRNHIGLVTQDVFLFSDTIERNILAGDFDKDPSRVVEAAKFANAHDFIEKTTLKYENRVGDRGNLLSGGEKQRISIARAIFKDAPILILDEATSALDSKNEAEVQKGLDSAMQGRTSLVIAHRLATVARADVIYVMRTGQLVESGTHQSLLKNGGDYSHLYDLQYNHQ
jgi:ATP-binding cassette, subfamily B, bacterial MsbA